MKNQNIVFIAIAFALAVALAPVSQGGISPEPSPTPGAEPAISIHSAGSLASTGISRGQTGSFVLASTTIAGASGTFVNFKVSGTAIAGVDYVALVSPAFIGQSGFGVILVKTLSNPRGSFSRQAVSVVVTLEPGAGYAVGNPSSAQILIEP